MSASEVARAHPVVVIGWEIADRLFGAVDPLEKTLQIEGVHFRIVGVSAARDVPGPIAGRVRDHPAPPVPDDFRRAPPAVAHRQAAGHLAARPGDGRCDAGAANRAAPQTEAGRQLRPVHVRDVPVALSAGDQRDLCRAGRHRRALAGRRRHRHHEHHADGGDGTDARDRPAEGARRAAFRHHGADAHRVGRAVGAWRHGRRRPGRDFRDRGVAVHADHRVGRAWSVALGIGITALVGLFFGCIRQRGAAIRSTARRNESRCASSLLRSRRDGARHRAQQQAALRAHGAASSSGSRRSSG